MVPIGDTLRGERLRRNLELPQIAQELKIPPRFLQAIEEERFDELPAAIFAKNFVRQYALLLGLDGDELSLQAQQSLEARSTVPEAPRAFKPDVAELPLDEVKSWSSSVSDRNSGTSWVTAAALFVAAMLVCSVAYWWWERPHKPAAAQAAATPASPHSTAPDLKSASASASTLAAPRGGTAAPTTIAQPAAESAKLPAAAPPMAAPPAAAAPAKPGAESNPNAAVRVEITAVDAVWVRARVDGKYLFSGTLQPRQTRKVDTDGSVELLVGNAGGATIALNGKPLELDGFPTGTVGPKGQPRLVQLTSGGFQMVPSKPPDARDR